MEVHRAIWGLYRLYSVPRTPCSVRYGHTGIRKRSSSPQQKQREQWRNRGRGRASCVVVMPPSHHHFVFESIKTEISDGPSNSVLSIRDCRPFLPRPICREQTPAVLPLFPNYAVLPRYGVLRTAPPYELIFVPD
jgi:hypothetical protein